MPTLKLQSYIIKNSGYLKSILMKAKLSNHDVRWAKIYYEHHSLMHFYRNDFKISILLNIKIIKNEVINKLIIINKKNSTSNAALYHERSGNIPVERQPVLTT